MDIHEVTHWHTTLLMHACEHEHSEIVDYLLTSKELTEHVNIDAKTDKGWNALLFARYYKKHHVVQKLLIEYDMKVDAETLRLIEELQYDDLIQMIKLRELYREMNQRLPVGQTWVQRKI